MQKYSSLRRRTTPFVLMICYLILAFFSSCKDENAKEKLDTSKVSLNYESVRFDKLFFALDTNNIYAGLDKIGRAHPDFTNLYLSRLAGLGEMGTPKFNQGIQQFLTHKDYRALWDTVQLHFPDMKDVDAELNTTFKNIKYFFPEEVLGKVYYFVSGLNLWSAITVDSAVGVGLDMYLGDDFPFYRSVDIPAYETRNRTPDRISVEVARAIFEAKFPFEYEGKKLLDMMIYKGKELYFTEQVCRTKSDDKLIGYSPEQIKFCNESEEGIYYFLVKEKHLYSSTWQQIMPFINDGPNTAGMPPESPGNIGSWVGWQIVKSYMKKHPETTMEQLIKLEMQAQKFLQAAKYKP